MSPLLLPILLLAGAAAHAQGLRYELASPNEEGVGFFGQAVAGLPDVDGDGAGDVLVGALFEAAAAGRAYVYSGASGELLHTLVSALPEPEAFFGSAVGAVPDTDGDGVGDLVVGAADDGDGGILGYGPGRAYVYSGASGAHRYTLVSPHPEIDGNFGAAVAGVPDVEGDGDGDVVVGAYYEDPGTSPREAGRTYVFSGASGALLHELASPNEERSGHFGVAVAGLGDLDGDGRGDVVVGAYREDPGDSPSGAGRAYVFSGASGALLYTLASPDEQAGGEFGGAVAGVDDLDGDGADDLLVGAYWEGPGGHAHVFSGASGAHLHTLTSPNEGRFGNAVSGVPDLDGDGAGDLLVGAYSQSPGPSPDFAGRAYVFSGATGALLRELASPNEEAGGGFGYAAAGVPDADGDGRGDLLAGARGEDPGLSPAGAGRAYVFSGDSTYVPALALAAAPLNSPVPRGERLRVAVAAHNPNAHPVAFALRLDAAGPGGYAFGGTLATRLVVGPGATVEVEREAVVPEDAPVGAYEGVVTAVPAGGGVSGTAAFAFAVVQGVGVAPAGGAPVAFALEGPHPNPSPARVVLTLVLPSPSRVRVAVHDALGREVAVVVEGPVGAGRHALTLDTSGLPSGVYVVRAVTGRGEAAAVPLTLVR